eukprot:Protomagalhaensia_wolfi_Nauph_80__4162@NODE_422_length_2547_cov_101_852073_g316_i0_p2_GENE_NODE_422_length_2547_cov_101_852073_g316_i0NODE_422_length_2547_cov_101_852073_g316_i0_p2_ORF_typecomplete_len175_score27_89TFIID31kDa/PF02291_15/2_8e08Bromo_TP/PF07524_13/0_15_NODE_422_length_2547_cov_101_852073_g316_i08401364
MKKPPPGPPGPPPATSSETGSSEMEYELDRLLMDVGALVRDQGCQQCTTEALLLLAEVARREIILAVEHAQRQGLYAGRSTVTDRDAGKALIERLEQFAPPDNVIFQQTSQTMAGDLNSFPLGAFPTDFVGLPLPPEAKTALAANWKFADPPPTTTVDEEDEFESEREHEMGDS